MEMPIKDSTILISMPVTLSDRDHSPRARRGLLPVSRSPCEWGEYEELAKVNGIEVNLQLAWKINLRSPAGLA